MRTLTIKMLPIILSVALIFLSCTKDVVPFTETETSKSKKSWDETAKAIATDVSKKLNSLNFRKMLKHEVLLRFDGDANVLLSAIIERLPTYLAYEASHTTASRTTEGADLLSAFSFDVIAEAARDYPQMQLAVQTDAESWDPNSFTPSVVYLTTDFDEATSTTVSGFDSKQNPITVSSTEDPTINYVVVSQNERTIFRGDQTLRFIESNCPVIPLYRNAPFNPEITPAPLIRCGGPVPPAPDPGGDETPGGNTPAPVGYSQYVGTGQDGVLPTLIGRQTGTIVPRPANGGFNRLASVGTFNGNVVYRKDYRHETMREVRCDALGQIESWLNGSPEIRLVVFEQNVLNPSETLQIFKEQMEPNKRKDINEKWWDCPDVDMHLWDYVGTGTKGSFGYYEYDPALIPNEFLVAVGEIIVDLLFLQTVDTTTTPNQMTIYGNIRQSVATGIRSLKMKNGVSEYIGKDDYSIFNDKDQWEHTMGGTKFRTWPDL